MSYQVLARKWRPRNFAELVGQSHVVQPLVNALDHGRLHHAFLFTGTRGVGKTTIARILAKSLNCETGVSSKPCGQCSACQEVDEGRFVDLIEVDAASRTKVDDTRELLDNVQYAPSRGRYKVYLIDEVHMLSGHSFNALLKTLEEPPPHVKFLLATTDPQKLPVTVLSRCLQFNLKRLSHDQIAAQIQKILDAEGIVHDAASIKLLARAADGSVRDGLSLLDQAIAYGGGQVNEAEVRAMLGTIEQDFIERLLLRLEAGDVSGLLQAVSEAAEFGLDYEAVLKELLLSLHRIAVAQADPALAGEEGEGVLTHARAMLPQDVQLYYQIGIMGQRDLPFAPDPRIGLEMTLLRMVAFRPSMPDETHAPVAAAATPLPKASAAKATAPPETKPDVETLNQNTSTLNGKWSEVVPRLGLTGLLRELANNTMLVAHSDGVMTLTLEATHAKLLSKEREEELRKALEKFHGAPTRLKVELGRPMAETPAQEKSRQQDERQQAAVQAIVDDPNVRALQEKFSARVNPASIRPKV
ncbi:MAG: DNA polymerase III subunit gamma/tau [Gammaproteobacteria bacterium]|nr:DNA polymerase III subunit gamma/tau [Gammaproteobacteria bacterium]MDH3406928.1 DNA polymerase III subunit gamma/tau [Gammaproteobacteria bacterium]MDH3562568.1 DNA polymerase III subunit gamma/tau [Gammaproteobacteria bacterium]MDH5486924.1 DNA polymerase III subunit gamma/tau [Gammaproteobacteria bacterium]